MGSAISKSDCSALDAADKDGLLDALMRIDWGIVDLKCIDTLLTKHDVAFDDLTPVLQHHCDKLADVRIDKSPKCDKFDKFNINVSNGSLRALIFIVFRYEKQMYDSSPINDLYVKKLRTGDASAAAAWLTAIFHRLNVLIDERFINLCKTSPLSDIVSYGSRHKIPVITRHVVAAVENPHVSVFKHFVEKCCKEFSLEETIDVKYITTHAHIDTFTWAVFENSYVLTFGTTINLLELAFGLGKNDIGNKLLSFIIENRKFSDVRRIKSAINAKTPITDLNWVNLCHHYPCKTYGNLSNANIMSICRHNNIEKIQCILKMFKPSVELLKMLHADKYAQSCATVSEDVYNDNKVLLYKEIIGNSQCKFIFDAVHLVIVRESRNKALIKAAFHRIGFDIIKDYDSELLDIVDYHGVKEPYDVVKSAISIGYTKDDFHIDKMLLKLTTFEQMNDVIMKLDLKKNDFDLILLFNAFSDISGSSSPPSSPPSSPRGMNTFVALIKHLEIDNFDFKRMRKKCSMEFVATVKSLFNLDADTCANLSRE
jgi:hypothetical protein